jgi:hypothetical protein
MYPLVLRMQATESRRSGRLANLVGIGKYMPTWARELPERADAAAQQRRYLPTTGNEEGRVIAMQGVDSKRTGHSRQGALPELFGLVWK